MSVGDEIRIRLVLHYDGAGFYGWQVQPERRTVEGELHAALERLTGGPRTLIGAGRTDRGVHATGQVAAVDVPPKWSAASLREALNAVLDDDVWVREARAVGRGFHPRYDAVARSYVYRLGLADEARSPFRRPYCWPLDDAVEVDLLHRAAVAIPGERSFGAFGKAGQPERGTRCHVHDAAWSPWEDVGLRFTVTADRYLHHMVRYLVGTMVDVARDRRPLAELVALLDDPETERWTSPPAPPEGLFLHRVDYPEAAPATRESEPTHTPRASET